MATFETGAEEVAYDLGFEHGEEYGESNAESDIIDFLRSLNRGCTEDRCEKCDFRLAIINLIEDRKHLIVSDDGQVITWKNDA